MLNGNRTHWARLVFTVALEYMTHTVRHDTYTYAAFQSVK